MQGLAAMKVLTVADSTGADRLASLAERLESEGIEVARVPPDLAAPEAGGPGRATAAAMISLEQLLGKSGPDALLLEGDSEVVLAAALVAAKLEIPLVRLGAGARSGDRKDPREINRLVTDRACDLLVCAEESALEELRREGLGARALLARDPPTGPVDTAREVIAWLEARASPG
jgi:UDP-N-acetylglucosamine 2-epimerase